MGLMLGLGLEGILTLDSQCHEAIPVLSTNCKLCYGVMFSFLLFLASSFGIGVLQ